MSASRDRSSDSLSTDALIRLHVIASNRKGTAVVNVLDPAVATMPDQNPTLALICTGAGPVTTRLTLINIAHHFWGALLRKAFDAASFSSEDSNRENRSVSTRRPARKFKSIDARAASFA